MNEAEGYGLIGPNRHATIFAIAQLLGTYQIFGIDSLTKPDQFTWRRACDWDFTDKFTKSFSESNARKMLDNVPGSLENLPTCPKCLELVCLALQSQKG